MITLFYPVKATARQHGTFAEAIIKYLYIPIYGRKMKKRVVVWVLLSIFIIVFWYLFVNPTNIWKKPDIETQKKADYTLNQGNNTPNATGAQETLQNLPSSKLSRFQATACSAADAAKTCDTKLKELDIVSKADCCKILNYCCGN